MNQKQHALAIAVLTELSKRVRRLDYEHRDALTEQMDRGDGITARSPIDGAKLGKVSMSEPGNVAEVVDARALDDWIRTNYPEKVRSHIEVTGDHDEVVRVLQQHAPHLLERFDTVPEWARNEVVKRSEAVGAPVGPGGEADVPGVEIQPGAARLSCRMTPEAPDAIEQMVRAGLVNLATGEVQQIKTGSAA